MINPQTVLSVIGATALLAVGAWLGRCSVGEPTPRMAIEFKQHAMTEDDIPTPTQPTTLTVYREPDSTRTECIEVPTWMDPFSSGRNESERWQTEAGTVDTAGGQRLTPSGKRLNSGTSGSLGMAGLPYVITPMTNGRPSLSVTSQTVTLSAVDPRDGRGLQFEYDIPQPNNRLSAYGSTQLLAGLPVAHMGAEYAHTWRDFWIFSSATAEWHGGYGITPEGPGEVFGATVTADIKW